MTSAPLDVQTFIDAHPFSALQRRLLALCFLVVAPDGFDVAIVGHIAPALRVEWSLGVETLGPLFAAGLFGLYLLSNAAILRLGFVSRQAA